MNSIKLNNIFLLVSFFLLIQFSVIEIHFAIYALLFLFFYTKVSIDLLKSLVFIILIFSIGLVSSFLQSKTLYNFTKDVIYFLIPILSLISGYFIAKITKSLTVFLRIIIFVTTIFSIVHLLTIFSQVNISS